MNNRHYEIQVRMFSASVAGWLFLTLALMQGCTRMAMPEGSVLEPGYYLQRAEKADIQGKHGEALRYYEMYLRNYADDPDAEKALMGAGRACYRLRNYEAAYSYFNRLGDRYPKSGLRDQSGVYKGLCLFKLGKYADSLGVLHSLEKRPLEPSSHVVVYFYLAENYATLRNVPSALYWYDRCYTAATQDKVRTRVEQQIKALLRLVEDEGVLREVRSQFPKGFIAEVAQLEQARLYYGRGEIRHAESVLQQLAITHPDDALTSEIQRLLSSITEEAGRHTCTIGCILPLSGRYERYGKDVLNALLLAARAFQAPEKGPVRIVIGDSKGDPEVGKRLVDELASNRDLMGIVGPLLGTVAKACAMRAEELKVPMITLTQKEDVAEAGDFVFQNSMTPRQQVETLVAYAREQLGLSRFAVLYPRDTYGQSFSQYFVRQVKESGGEVVSQVSYDKKDTDFQATIRELVGEGYWQGVQNAVKEGKEGRGIDDIHLEPIEREIMQRGGVGPKGSGITAPFQALFIPDDCKKVAMIAPYLALYDLTAIKLMGTAGWNSPRLLEEAGEYVQGAIFVDGFFPESPNAFVQEFVEHYSKDFKKAPSVLEAQGYDSLLMMDEAFHRAVHKTREGLRDELARLKEFQGLSGQTGFDEKGRARKRLYVLSVVNNHIVQIQ